MDLSKFMGNADFQKMVAERLGDMMGADSGMAREYFEGLPEEVKQRVEVLREIQEEHDDLEEQFEKERKALEAKYRGLMAPLYTRRQDIVDGKEEVEGAKGDVKGVPEFWYVCLRNAPEVAQSMGEKDEEILKHLVKVEDEPLKDREGFTLTFTFGEGVSEFFAPPVLTKTYLMAEEDEEMLEKCEATEIQWVSGKDPTVKLLKKKGKKGKTQFKQEKCESFFNFFNPPKIPEAEDDIDEDEMEELQMTLEGDYDMGIHIRDTIIPNAVAFFTGEALEDDEDDEDDDDEGHDGGDSHDDDDDEDDEDDEEEGAEGAKDGEKPAECKQQ